MTQQREQQPYQPQPESHPSEPAVSTAEEQGIRGDLERLADLSRRFAVARQVINEKRMISATRAEAEQVLTNNVQCSGE